MEATPLTVSKNKSLWSPAAQGSTLEHLECLMVQVFMQGNRAHLKRLQPDNSRERGFIRLENALADRWLVENEPGVKVILYTDVRSLVNDGWVLD